MDITFLLSSAVITLIVILIYKYIFVQEKTTEEATTIPGPAKSDPVLGNLPDLAKAGSLHQYLIHLHQKYGDIVHFWFGQQLTVTVSTPELFKQQSKVFDRPPPLFALFQPFLTEHSIQYANGEDGRLRHTMYSRCFSEKAVSNYYPMIQHTTDEIIDKLNTFTAEQHIPLSENMFAYAANTILIAVFGETFKDHDEVLKLTRSFDSVWADLENQLKGETLEEGTPRMEEFKKHCAHISDIIKVIYKTAEDSPSDNPDMSKLLDVVVNANISHEKKIADLVSFLVASFHTTGLLLTWALYYLGQNPDVQQAIEKEVLQEVGQDSLSPDVIGKLVYVRQVIDETMRCTILAPFSARFQHVQAALGNHVIPADTPVIHALGVSHHDPTHWQNPEKFDPDRFSAANRKKIPSFGFEPFGFAGKRKCPGFRFSLVDSTIFLADLCRKFEICLVPGQDVVPYYGLVTKPTEEIWITVRPKQKKED